MRPPRLHGEAAALLDRPLRHSHVVTIWGDSYRLREKHRRGLLQKSAPAPQPLTACVISTGGNSWRRKVCQSNSAPL
ncbi:ATP-binding protein [Astrobacterium formosum]|uniref:ATP-binding protein n=1 Tax=Astrobacterium formosum TaxID=3069710 RepID=UPI003F5089AC